MFGYEWVGGHTLLYFWKWCWIFFISIQILNLICLICIGSGYYFRGSGWYYFVASSGFTTELLVLLFAIFSCTDRIQGITIVRSHLLVITWNFVYHHHLNLGFIHLFQALIFCGLWCFFYLTAASAVLNVAINFSGLDGLYAAVVCSDHGIGRTSQTNQFVVLLLSRSLVSSPWSFMDTSFTFICKSTEVLELLSQPQRLPKQVTQVLQAVLAQMPQIIRPVREKRFAG